VLRLSIVHPALGQLERRFDSDEVTLGRTPENQVVLLGPNVSERHARLMCRGSAVVLCDAGGPYGTFVNGARIARPTILGPTDTIAIGHFRLALVAARPPLDAVEARFLAALEAHPREPAARLVYADWLEERGERHKAELLRLQRQMAAAPANSAELVAVAARLKEVLPHTDAAWRALIAEVPIENCRVRLTVRCPQQWDALEPTDRPGVRRCGACARDVHYCRTVEDVSAHAMAGECVAVDAGVPRRPDDLAPSAPPAAWGTRDPPIMGMPALR
jgi:uncharacterized protein (TIGR02996 family)